MAAGIVVDFSANLARFTSAIDKASNDLSRFQTNAQRTSKNISNVFSALGVGLSVTAVVAFGKSVIDTADNMGKAAEKAGVSVEKFSLLNYAAEQSELSTQQLSISLKFLNSAIVENSKVLGALGVATKNATGQLRGTDEVLLDVAEAFKSLPDGALKSEAAVKLFGKSGLDMINLLNQGRGGIEAFTSEAKKMGLEISGNTAASADEFNDNLGRLKGTMMGMANDVLPSLLDGLKKVTDLFGVGAKADYVQTTATDFYRGLIKNAQGEIAKLNESRNDLFGASQDTITAKIKDKQQEILGYAKLLDDLLQKEGVVSAPKSRAAPKGLAEALGGGDKAGDESKKRADAEKKRGEDLIKANKEYVKSLQDKALTLGLTEKQVALYEMSQKNLTDTQREAAIAAIESAAAQKDQDQVFKDSSEAIKKIAEEQAALNILYGEEEASKLIKYGEAMERAFPERRAGKQYVEDFQALSAVLGPGSELDAAVAGLGEQFNTVGEKSKTISEEFTKVWGHASRSFSDNFGRATADAILNSTKGIDVLRSGVKSFAREMIGAIISIGAQRTVLWALGETQKKISTATQVASNTAIAATAAPAAAGVTLASFGANIPIALAGIAAAFALTKILGQAGDGIESTPHTGTYLLNKGERVVKVEDNKKLQKFLDGGNGGGSINITFNVVGRDAPRASEIVASQRNQIISIIQGAYENRLVRGGPLR
jgi:hypothetical protein